MRTQQQRAVEAFHARGYYGLGGLGLTSQQITSTVGGSIMAAAGPIALVNPLAGAIVAGVGALTSLIGGLFRPDVTKIEATRIVDQIESQYLKPNLERWQSASVEQKTRSAQTAALTLVDQALQAVRQGCSNPALGEAGQRCISERLIQGGTAPWCPTQTGCDWITLYKLPIQNDPAVYDDPSPVAGSVSSFFGSGGVVFSVPMPLLIGAALLGVGLLWSD